MASRRSHSRLAQLWQFPLLLISVGLFGVAAYLFINPGPGLTIDQKIDIARTFLKQERPDASLAQLNKLLETENLDVEHQGKIHILLAESLEMGQTQLKIDIPANHRRIIEQTRLATANGVKLDANAYRRMGESYEALGNSNQALDNYRKAMSLDPDHALHLQRKVITLQLDQDDAGPAEASLDEYLKEKDITDAERAWALNQKAQLDIDASQFTEARSLLADALKLSTDPVAQGEVNYRLGYSAYKLGDLDGAERYLRVARDELQVRHPLDADASYWLGKIYQDRNDPQTANSFYQVVMTSHIDSKVMPLALMGRGLCRLMLKDEDAGLSDLHDLTHELLAKPSRAKLKEPAIVGLRQASVLLANREEFQGALEVLDEEQQLDPTPSPNFYERLGAVFEKRADQLEQSLPTVAAAEQIRRAQQVREMRTHAGDAFVAYSQKLTLTDDKGYGDAMWHGIDLYDRASAIQYTVSALELFVAERPDDKLAPDAYLRMGRAYQAAGSFDKAISAFQHIQFRYPQSLAASKSAVPLAQAYIAKGPDFFPKAEEVLLSVVDNNRLIDPDAEEFKQALFDVAQLYYRTERFEEAVAKLEEFTQRYPNDERMGQLLFLMADSYRKSASLLDARLASAKSDAPLNDLAEVAAAKRERLGKAKELYDKVVDMYRDKAPADDVDKLYLKLSHFYRADCVYDLGNYADAVKLYDSAAFRYQDDPSALAAYVQIVNAYCAMGKMDEAKTANERAKWLLRKIPPQAFNDGTFSMPKEYWEQWLKWTSNSGMW